SPVGSQPTPPQDAPPTRQAPRKRQQAHRRAYPSATPPQDQPHSTRINRRAYPILDGSPTPAPPAQSRFLPLRDPERFRDQEAEPGLRCDHHVPDKCSDGGGR